MGRSAYVQMRKTGQYDLSWFYAFYLKRWEELKDEKGYEEKADRNTFMSLFTPIMNAQFSAILNYLDSYFKVNVLTDKNGKLITAY